MIYPLISYFLLSNVSNTNWINGPEYEFSFIVTVDTEGPNLMELYPGYNVTNEIKCRPKDEDALSCTFRHKKFEFYNRNLTSGDIIQRNFGMSRHQRRHVNHRLANATNKNPFEVVFDKNGVQKLVVSEGITRDVRLDGIKTMVNLMNTGMDLSTKIPEGSQVTTSEEMINFLIGRCMSEIQVSLKPTEPSHSNSYNLDLVEPLPKLAGRRLNVDKSLELKNCPDPIKSVWSGMVVKDLQKDLNLNMIKAIDMMTITENNFVSEFLISMEITKNGYPLLISESMKLELIGINSADGEIPDVKDPAIVSLN